MKRIFIIILLICIIIQSGLCQEKGNAGTRILFSGLVMDANSLSPLSNSQIIINRAFSSVSGSDGTFAFYVRKNDTIIFRSLGYKSTVLYVGDTLAGREFIIGIYMTGDTLSIGEVVIISRLANIKSEILNTESKTPAIIENARYNVAVSSYQGRNSQNRLGNPAANYEFLRQSQKVNAYERGGIPSDKMIGISPLLLIPATYLLIHGLPEKPAPLTPQLTNQEVNQIHKKYMETLVLRK